MASLWTSVGTELAALGRIALSMALRPLLPAESREEGLPGSRPVVLIHGLLGDPTNFLALRNHLVARGAAHFASFSYLPRLDFQRLAPELRQTIDAARERTGATQVDIVGHSLGGLVARHLLETDDRGSVRRLITLGTPYCGRRIPEREYAIFGSEDPLVAPPPASYGPAGRVRIIQGCGHLGLLYDERAQQAVTRFLVTHAIGGSRLAASTVRAAA
jgi:pimeloyl-ACP methyl ester carboxylesterase